LPRGRSHDLSRSLTAFDPISTSVVVVEMSKASWLVSGAVTGVERQPLKKLEPDATALLRLPSFNRGANPYQETDLLIKLRNEFIHYKSEWAEQVDREKIFSRLEQLGFDKPAFMSPHTNFFPHRCLSASLASWSVTIGAAFINSFYDKLAIASPLAANARYLTVPPAEEKKSQWRFHSGRLRT
jgi:hypothetical protein